LTSTKRIELHNLRKDSKKLKSTLDAALKQLAEKERRMAALEQTNISLMDKLNRPNFLDPATLKASDEP
jgi:hypothetical protein